jgi:CHAT domain-containing protein
MLLAVNGALPSKEAILLGESTEGLLSPERIGQLDPTGSHVTTQACSTGLSKEGSGGDALGLEWAFLLAGAASTLTAHWDVPLRSSSEFVLRFYNFWFVNGTTRAEAWRSAALGMLRNGAPPEDWGGFSLAGDWR